MLLPLFLEALLALPVEHAHFVQVAEVVQPSVYWRDVDFDGSGTEPRRARSPDRHARRPGRDGDAGRFNPLQLVDAQGRRP